MLILQQWLIEQRQAKNLSLEQLADRLNKPFSYVQDVENGQYLLDVVEYLFYCKALDINPNQVLNLFNQT
jgi:cytoskeletal protein RodZ